MLRNFHPDDQHAIRVLILHGLRERWGPNFDADFNPDLDDIEASYISRGADVVVIEQNGELVATGMLIPEDPTAARIVRMSVSHLHRREGLARQIVHELVGRARDQELEEVRVLTDTPWTSAVALYQSCGFKQTSRDSTATHFVMAL